MSYLTTYTESKTRAAGFLEYFPLSNKYVDIPLNECGIIREAKGCSRTFDYSERHLQAVWYDERWRPKDLMTASGETIRVEYPGRWNLEAGPDFIGATIVVGPDERRMTGDVEIHIVPADWKHHGHHHDKRYRNVCLHVTYYEGVLPDEALPSGTLQLSLRSSLQSDPSFAFEHIDVSSYPFSGRADVPPCRIELSGWPIEQKAALLDAAGHERLRRKACRFESDVNEHGIDQAFYRAFLSALGYQHNRRPFCVLSDLLPLDRLRVLSKGDSLRAYAILSGVSGLLPETIDPRWSNEARNYIRSLWDIWWKIKDSFPRVMNREEWQLRAIRPLNHPLRRLASAAHVFSREFDTHELLKSWAGEQGGGMMSEMRSFVEPPGESFWSHHIGLGSRPKTSRMAIVGMARLNTFALNVCIPMSAALGLASGRVASMRAAVKPEPINQYMRQAGFYLFGPDAPSTLLGTSIRRQGLLQVFQDHCMQDRSRCSGCAFPRLLEEMARKAGQ